MQLSLFVEQADPVAQQLALLVASSLAAIGVNVKATSGGPPDVDLFDEPYALPAGWQMAIELRQVPLYPSQIARSYVTGGATQPRRLLERCNERARQRDPFSRSRPSSQPSTTRSMTRLGRTSSTSRSSKCRSSLPVIRACSMSNRAPILATLPGTSRTGASGHLQSRLRARQNCCLGTVRPRRLGAR